MRIPGSFRDPAGFVFEQDGKIFRRIEPGFEADLNLLVNSGLQQELVEAGLTLAFETCECGDGALIQPERVPFISYPYEWSFGQLKDAALTTLEIARRAIGKGMILKDASAYNIQFLGHRPVLIDTLSFEAYQEGEPWIAYKQFCQHFLAPLALMSHCDIRLGALLQSNIDGIPLDLAANLLPGKTKLNAGLLTHIHLHAKAAATSTGKAPARQAHLSKLSLLALLDSLKGAISGLTWNPSGTEWGNYYEETNYSDQSFRTKHDLVKDFLARVDASAQSCWDLGANNGEFSRLAVERGLRTIAWDIDPAAVELAYRFTKQSNSENLLALMVDLRSPSPALGWANQERDSLARRGPADVLLALALIHHIAIGNNVPLPMIADFFAQLGKSLIIEFVPKEDSQVQRMLVARKDIFTQYNETGFEEAFATRFTVEAKQKIEGTARTLYFMKRIES